MKRPTFLEGVVVALALSLVGAAVYSATSLFFSGGWLIRALIAALSLAYICYLISRSGQRLGSVTTLALWNFAAIAAWLLNPPLLIYTLLHLGLIWLVRSLYFYTSPLSAVVDMGLTGLSFMAAIWAIVESQSVFAGLWCFFLVQALFAAIPANFNQPRSKKQSEQTVEDQFDRAYHAAETALRQLYSNH